MQQRAGRGGRSGFMVLLGVSVLAVLSLLAYLAAWLVAGVQWGLVAWWAYPVVGWWILQQRPGHRIGWALLAIGGWWAIAMVGALTSVPLLLLLADVAAYQGWLTFLMLLLLYPTGATHTLLGRVTLRLVLVIWVVVLVLFVVQPTLESFGQANRLALPELAPIAGWVLGDQGFVLVPAMVLLVLVDLVLRWRRSTGVERLQLRWFGWAVAIVGVSFAVNPGSGQDILLQMLMPTVIPIAIGIAITRHGLYAIDRVISRTVSYGIVTVVVVATYVLVVTSVSRLLPDSGALPVAGATLAAAAVFLPVLQRVRSAVDRRFDRARFDAQQQVEAFAERMNTSVEAEGVAADLLTTVQRTLAPAAVGVWRRGEP